MAVADQVLWPLILTTWLVQPVFIFAALRYVCCGGTANARALFVWLINAGGGGVDVEPEVRDEIAKLVTDRRVACSRIVCVVLWTVGCLQTWVLAPIVVGGLGTGYTSLIVAHGALVLTVSLAAVFRSALVTARTLPLVYGVCMAILCCAGFAEVPIEMTPFRSVGLAAVSLQLGGLCLRFRALVFGNLCLLICNALSHSLTYGSDQGVLKAAILMEFLALAVKTWLFFCADFVLQRGARNEVAARLGKCQQSAVSSLLSLMCDAVLELDHTWAMKDHVAKLASMLIHGVGRSLQGEPLSSFMPDETDRERFEAALRRSNGQSGALPDSAGMLSLRLRDSMGNLLKVVVFHVPYVNISGRIHHLIGLRERSDTSEVSDLPSSGGLGGVYLPPSVLRPDIERQLAKASEASAGGRMSVASSISGSSGGREEAPDRNLSVEVYIEDGLPVAWVAEGLRRELGVQEGELKQFGHVLADSGRLLFAWLQAVLNDSLLKGRRDEYRQCFGDIEIVPRHANAEETICRKAHVYFPPLRSGSKARHMVSIALSGNGRKRPKVASSRGTPAVCARQNCFGDPGDVTVRTSAAAAEPVGRTSASSLVCGIPASLGELEEVAGRKNFGSVGDFAARTSTTSLVGDTQAPLTETGEVLGRRSTTSVGEAAARTSATSLACGTRSSFGDFGDAAGRASTRSVGEVEVRRSTTSV